MINLITPIFLAVDRRILRMNVVKDDDEIGKMKSEESEDDRLR